MPVSVFFDKQTYNVITNFELFFFSKKLGISIAIFRPAGEKQYFLKDIFSIRKRRGVEL